MKILCYSDVLTGLARECPNCGLLAHYEVKGREEVNVDCVECGFSFAVKKYKRGQRPRRTSH